MSDLRFVFVKKPPYKWYICIIYGFLEIVSGVLYICTAGHVVLMKEFWMLLQG